MNIQDLFESQITEEIRKIVRERILEGGDVAHLEVPNRIKKLALLVMMSVTPFETLFQEETALLYGLSPKALAKRQSTGDLPNKINIGK